MHTGRCNPVLHPPAAFLYQHVHLASCAGPGELCWPWQASMRQACPAGGVHMRQYWQLTHCAHVVVSASSSSSSSSSLPGLAYEFIAVDAVMVVLLAAGVGFFLFARRRRQHAARLAMSDKVCTASAVLHHACHDSHQMG